MIDGLAPALFELDSSTTLVTTLVTLVVFEVGSTEVVVVILTLPSLIVVVALASEEVDLTVVVFEVLSMPFEDETV